jgi:tetratricopeptide (TPR) repeat protein
MQLLRQKRTVLVLAIAIVSLVAGLGAWRYASQPTVASERLDAAAEQRPVSKTDQMIWDYQQRVREKPKDSDSYAMLGAAYLQKARETADPTYYGKAQAAIDEAVRLDPTSVEALIGAGTLANARHQFHQALEIGQRALALDPSVSRIYGVIADAQIELGMYVQSVETLQKMVDLRPDLSSYSRISYARELHGDLDGAIEAMQTAVEAGGQATENSAWVQVQLGNLFFTKGDLESAEREYQRTLALLPDYVYAQAGMARVRAAQGNIDEATTLYRRAVERMPLPEFVIALGELQEATGHLAEAAKQYPTASTPTWSWHCSTPTTATTRRRQ